MVGAIVIIVMAAGKIKPRAACLAVFLLLLAGCSKVQEQQLKPLEGSIHDQIYISPLGSFSVDLTDDVDVSSLQDAISKDGSAIVCGFADKAGNHYSIMATFIRKKPQENFIASLVKKNLAQGKQVVESRTSDGRSSYQESYLGQNQQGRYVAKLEIVFYKELILFDIILTGKDEKQAQPATQHIDVGLNQLWERTIFRGRFRELPGSPARLDPRIPITVYAAKTAAENLGYTVELQRTGKQIVRVYTQGKYSRIIISLGVQQVGTDLVVSEAVSCIAKDEKFADHIKMIFFVEFEKRLAQECIKIKRSRTYDEDLLLNP